MIFVDFYQVKFFIFKWFTTRIRFEEIKQFLIESLYHRIITRAARWTLMKNGVNVKSAVRMYLRKTRFYLDELHDFVIEMGPIKKALLKVLIVFEKKLNLFLNIEINLNIRFK